MTSGGSPTKGAGAQRTVSLWFLLLVCLNGTMVLVVGAFAAWDYSRAWDMHLRQRRDALRSEAEGLLAGVVRLRNQPSGTIQALLDEVCLRMRERWSPGHHIALVLDEKVLQTTLHRPSSPRLLAAVESAAAGPLGLGATEGGLVVVGAARRDGASVFVSEYVTDIEGHARAQLLRRLLTIVSLGLALVAAVNVFAVRFVTNPLGAVVRALRQIREGELGAEAPVPGTTEMAFLAREVNAMSKTLAETDEERRREMRRARRIQENLIPSHAGVNDLPVAFRYQPAALVAGDYLDVARGEHGALLLCLADVAGHGVPAALLAAMLKVLFTSAVADIDDPASVLEHMNRRLCDVTLPEDFASMIVVRVDRLAGRIHYASAGHELCYLTQVDGQQRVLSATGSVMGVDESGHWDGEQLSVAAGDRLVLVSDGVAETASPAQQVFGRARLAALLRACGDVPLKALPDHIMASLRRHRGSALQADDVTILAMQM